MINRQDAKVAKRGYWEHGEPQSLRSSSAFLASWRLTHSNSFTLGRANVTPTANKTMTAPPAASAHCAP